jgi:hypothetical protein
MNMLAVSLLLLPVMIAFALVYGPAVQASLNSGNEIMTASSYTFQSDTFSAAGAIGSLGGNMSDPVIITGRWHLDVENGSVSNFSAYFTMVNASGAGYRTVQLEKLESSKVMMKEDGITIITGVTQTTINSTEKLGSVNATIALTRLTVFNMTLDRPGYLGMPIYGIADPPEETITASSNILTEGSGIYGNISEKFRLPQLPNPFK